MEQNFPAQKLRRQRERDEPFDDKERKKIQDRSEGIPGEILSWISGFETLTISKPSIVSFFL